ncbi:MAG: hypothetical protein H7138_16515, partial [Myxococcales bacterium]|nr:hypothetical protein [Myxococcales bacterium]
MSSYDKKAPQPGGGAAPGQSQARGPGKQTLVEQIGVPPIQRRDVARYPEGQVRYTLPGGSSGVAATTGKTKWYEWVGYAGLAAAAVGLALVTAGASVPATVCFAAGALA